MLTLALSFSVFSTSVFKMVNTLIESEIKSFTGADLAAFTTRGTTFLDEPKIRSFLDSNLKTVESYSFLSCSVHTIVNAVDGSPVATGDPNSYATSPA